MDPLHAEDDNGNKNYVINHNDFVDNNHRDNDNRNNDSNHYDKFDNNHCNDDNGHKYINHNDTVDNDDRDDDNRNQDSNTHKHDNHVGQVQSEVDAQSVDVPRFEPCHQRPCLLA